VLVVVIGLLVSACTSVVPFPSSGDASPSASASATAAASYPPDAQVAWIAFQSDDLRLVRPDGSGSRLALPDGPTDARHPRWSPDGARLAFVADEGDTRDIWIADWDGGNARRIFDCEAPCTDADSPAWSPDGSSIVFRRYDFSDDTFPGSSLELIEVASGSVQTIATTLAPDYIDSAGWSPDGRSLVVGLTTYQQPVTNQSPAIRSSIAVLSLDDPDRALVTITDLDTFPVFPEWSPNGDLILFQAGMKNLSEIDTAPVNLWTIRPDGTGLSQLTHFGLDEPAVWLPGWAPDGLSIWVTVTPRDGQGHHRLGRLLADGTGLVLMPGPVPGAHPRQRPMPAG
jgi:TolB protein